MTEPHAEIMRRAAIELGVKTDRIKTFPLAKDTEEEANMMKPHLEGKRAALVTEASHLKRASIFFELAGINIIPAPALYLGSRKKRLANRRHDQLQKRACFLRMARPYLAVD